MFPKEKLLQEQVNQLSCELKKAEKEFSDKIRQKEEEYQDKISALKENYRQRESKLLQRLKKNEALFQEELNIQINQIKRAWSWRIIQFFILPIELVKKILSPFIRSFYSIRKLLNKLFSANYTEPISPGSILGDFDFDDQVKNLNLVNVAAVFDEFTRTCFHSEFNVINFTPGNWQKVLNSVPTEAFFIESAWNGIGGSWRNKICHISDYNQQDMLKLLRWVKEKKTPTIFWNKEDPVHYQGFIDVAKQFDYIFTTDSDCIPDYQAAAGHKNVFALPFAAQPDIHNPVRSSPRSGIVCFAGTYYARKYAERRGDMDFLLQPAIDFGLDIFDRNYGTAASKAGIYKFPDIYQNNIRGRLDYNDMVKAYKNYKVFLNVNSVRYSPTMFARRVFELLACGTPVISTYSQGIINILGEETVLISDSEEETRKHLETLIHDQEYWWKISLAGMRKVLKHHTYNERVGEIFSNVGLPFRPYQWNSFTVVTKVSSLKQIHELKNMLDSQVYTNFDVILIESLSASFNGEERQLARQLFKEKLRDIIPLGVFEQENLADGLDQSNYIAFLDPDCFYGKHYLEDYALAVRYAKPEIIGKSSYIVIENDDLKFINKGHEFTYTSSAPNESVAVHHSLLSQIRFKTLLEKGFFEPGSTKIFSADPYNFVRIANTGNNYSPADAMKQKIEL